MIFEVAAAAAAAAAVAYSLRQMRDRRAPPPAPEENKPQGRQGPRGLRRGDVVLYADSEFWLGGVLELMQEGEFVARLFSSPGTERASWVLQLDAAGNDVALLNPTDAVPAGRVPAELPIGGIRHQLEQRGKAMLQASGDGVPSATIGEFVVLGGTAGRLIFVLDCEGKHPRIALAGERMPKEMLELLPGDEDDDPMD